MNQLGTHWISSKKVILIKDILTDDIQIKQHVLKY